MHRIPYSTTQPLWRGIVSVTVALVITLAAASASATERFRLELEGAAARQSRNDFAIPGATGTRVRLDRPASDPVAAGRVTLMIGLGPRWAARALAAPLSTRTTFIPVAPTDTESSMAGRTWSECTRSRLSTIRSEGSPCGSDPAPGEVGAAPAFGWAGAGVRT